MVVENVLRAVQTLPSYQCRTAVVLRSYRQSWTDKDRELRDTIWWFFSRSWQIGVVCYDREHRQRMIGTVWLGLHHRHVNLYQLLCRSYWSCSGCGTVFRWLQFVKYGSSRLKNPTISVHSTYLRCGDYSEWSHLVKWHICNILSLSLQARAVSFPVTGRLWSPGVVVESSTHSSR